MASCNTIDDINPTQDILFAFSAETNAKAIARSININEVLDGDGFGVFVKESGNNWTMFNTSVTKNGASWSYGESVYRNESSKVEIYAYAPYNSQATIIEGLGENGNGIGVAYTTSTSPESSNTLSYGVCNNPNNAVSNINFNKALATVGLDFSVVIDGRTATVEAQKAQSGETIFSLGDGNTIEVEQIELSGNFYGGGVIDIVNGEWNTNEERINSIVWSKEDLAVNEGQAESFRLNNDAAYMHLIPQVCSSNDAIRLTVTYTTTNPSGFRLTEKVVSSAKELRLNAGNTYMLDINISLNTISFNPSVVNWQVEDLGF